MQDKISNSLFTFLFYYSKNGMRLSGFPFLSLFRFPFFILFETNLYFLSLYIDNLHSIALFLHVENMSFVLLPASHI